MERHAAGRGLQPDPNTEAAGDAPLIAAGRGQDTIVSGRSPPETRRIRTPNPTQPPHSPEKPKGLS
jgi:hypothetical protein